MSGLLIFGAGAGCLPVPETTSTGPMAAGGGAPAATPASLSIAGGPTVNFGNVTSGGNLDTVLTVTNSGGSAASFATLSTALLGLGAPFTLNGGTCSSDGLVTAGASCTLIINYAPPSLATHTATLNLSYNDGSAPRVATIDLIGTGSTPAVLAFSPTSKAYGNVTVGSSSSQTFTVINSGAGIATSLYVGLTGTGYSLANNNCGVTGTRVSLAGSATCTFDVVFAPSATGASAGTVSLGYNDGAAPQSDSAALTATGITPSSLAFSPTSKAYGSVTVGNSSSQTFTLTNSGATTATSVYVGLTGTGYSLANNNCGVTGTRVSLASAASCTFDVVFAPGSAGASAGTASLSYNDGATTQLGSAALTATGITASTLAFSPTSIAFGNVTVGSSATQTFAITNSGATTATAVYIGVATTDYALSSNNCGVTGSRVSLAAGATCTFDLIYTPTAAAASSGSVALSFHDGVATQSGSAAFSGTGIAPASLGISDAAIFDYASVTRNTTSSKTFTITNSGGTAASLSGLTTAGLSLAAPFTLNSGTCVTLGTVAAGGGTCTLIVDYAPTTAAVHTDTIVLNYNNGASAQTASRDVMGTGITPASLAFSPTSKAFGNITVAGTSATQTFTITNSGASSATGVYIGITGTGMVLANNNCGVTGTRVTLAAAGTCTFDVAFAPASTGAISGSVALDYHDGASAQTGSATITGTAVTPASLAFSPTSKDFGSVAVGGSSTQAFTLTNSGGSSATSAYIAISGTDLALANNNCGVTGARVTIAASGTCTFDVVFSPTSTAAAAGSLALSYNDGATTQSGSSVALSGTGTNSNLFDSAIFDSGTFGP